MVSERACTDFCHVLSRSSLLILVAGGVVVGGRDTAKKPLRRRAPMESFVDRDVDF